MFSQNIILIARSVALLLCIVLIGSSASAQFVPSEATDSGLGGNNNLTGTVYTPGGRLTRRVTIRLTTMTRGDRIASTDDNGNFSFRGLVSGTYTLVIDKEKEFEPYSQAVEIIQMRGSPPQTYTLSVRLTPKSTVPPRASVIDAAVSTLPERGKTLFLKSQDLSKAGDHTGAIDQLLILTGEFPNFMPGFNELGVEYLRLNQLEKADAAFQQAIKIDGEAFQPKLNRGMTLVTMKRYSEAEQVLLAAKKSNEQSGALHYFLGQAQANLGKFDEAEKELTKAVGMGGDEMSEAHRILAIIYSSKGEKVKAAAELETYLRMNPKAADAEQLQKVLQSLRAQAGKAPLNQP